MGIGVDERRLAIEIIASLVNVKHTMAELVLDPSGVPPEVYRPILALKDETNNSISKRKAAPLILDRLGPHEELVINWREGSLDRLWGAAAQPSSLVASSPKPAAGSRGRRG
jgi:hypothetical protein